MLNKPLEKQILDALPAPQDTSMPHGIVRTNTLDFKTNGNKTFSDRSVEMRIAPNLDEEFVRQTIIDVVQPIYDAQGYKSKIRLKEEFDQKNPLQKTLKKIGSTLTRKKNYSNSRKDRSQLSFKRTNPDGSTDVKAISETYIPPTGILILGIYKY
tara:strand:- start:386 stop:850 length:465 start_codon:yes stop_codon:yes gene_type:complete